jgi:nitrate/nitrite transport system substrate-binding protein
MTRRGPLLDPFSHDSDLGHAASGQPEPDGAAGPEPSTPDDPLASPEALMDRVVESAVVRAVFGGNELARRTFIEAVGRGTFVAALSSVFPLAACKSTTKEEVEATVKGASTESTKNPLEKKKLDIGLRAHHLCDAHHHGPPDGLL